jgi:hypothetical protein
MSCPGQLPLDLPVDGHGCSRLKLFFAACCACSGHAGQTACCKTERKRDGYGCAGECRRRTNSVFFLNSDKTVSKLKLRPGMQEDAVFTLVRRHLRLAERPSSPGGDDLDALSTFEASNRLLSKGSRFTFCSLTAADSLRSYSCSLHRKKWRCNLLVPGDSHL